MNEQPATAFDYFGDPLRVGARVRVLGQKRHGVVASVGDAGANTVRVIIGDASVIAVDSECMILRGVDLEVGP